MNIVLTIDFGSTFTKISAVDIENAKIIATAKSFTTIETDVRHGLENALAIMERENGKIEFSKKIASSSAAGGLKMISSGLVPELTAKAAKMAANSAGAKVLRNFSFELSSLEQEEIRALQPDIILLCGGIDGGNKEVIVHNAKILARTEGDFFVIIAGNKAVSKDVWDILEAGGKRSIITENVMPEFNKLNIAPAKEQIRELFIKNIIEAKGLDVIQKSLDADIIPTPLAVFEAAELLSKGTRHEAGLGSLMAYDVGGATTDVYSMAGGEPTKPNVMLKGFKEPFSKRTVEGDIGMRYSISSLVSEANAEIIAENVGLTKEAVIKWMETCKKDPGILAEPGTDERRIDEELAAFAVEISANRHCGYIETIYTPFGESYIQSGKDLTPVNYVIGAGGSVINSINPGKVLSRSVYSQANYDILKPQNPKFLLDKKSIFAAMGLVGRLYPDTAIKIMKNEFIEV